MKKYIIYCDQESHTVRRRSMEEAIQHKNTLNKHYNWIIKEQSK
jgi:hypothetical protein